MTEWLTRSERDRYWMGRILFLRHKIEGLCRQEGCLSKTSVIRAIDECLPESIVDKEVIGWTKTKTRKKQ